ncbi:MAG: GTP-binding protein [Deltaproteobacteria bacterium RIFOXYA12_FULL_58_15]|nr:MAG: GTP-binding protein [Deltaproteobacteria bacterium RIFOXYA12_FULL_58_15]OGR11640.1 MAG: GTP-binding protein [Deltaproteobacteria bacterium RIFOXYB12_FULL_58_9]
MYVHRSITGTLLQLSDNFPVVVVVGARQVGKSTLVNHAFPNTECVVFDPVTDVDNARRDPELFLRNHSTPLVLDEIQYAPELVSAIKRYVDRDRSPGQFILTGSQQWQVISSMAESLAGRAVFVDLDGFSLAETTNLLRGAAQMQPVSDRGWLGTWLGSPEELVASPPDRLPVGRNLYELLWRGALPDAQLLTDAVTPNFLSAYMRTYIERDVRLLAEVSDWQQFGRFVRIVAALTAQEVNHSQLGREIGLTPQTAKRWLGMLMATFQWYEIPAYSGNPIKRVSGKPKGFVADTGVACMAQSVSSPRAVGSHPLFGALFETAVVNEIRKQCALLSPKPNMYHWRSFSKAEVDILLERDGVFFPIEIKGTSRPSRRDTTGISAFRKGHPKLRIADGMVIAPTDKVQKISDRDYAVPWDLGGALSQSR